MAKVEKHGRHRQHPSPDTEPAFIPNLAVPMMGSTSVARPRPSQAPSVVLSKREMAHKTMQADYDVHGVSPHRRGKFSGAKVINNIAGKIFDASAALIDKNLIESDCDSSDEDKYSQDSLSSFPVHYISNSQLLAASENNSTLSIPETPLRSVTSMPVSHKNTNIVSPLFFLSTFSDMDPAMPSHSPSHSPASQEFIVNGSDSPTAQSRGGIALQPQSVHAPPPLSIYSIARRSSHQCVTSDPDKNQALLPIRPPYQDTPVSNVCRLPELGLDTPESLPSNSSGMQPSWTPTKYVPSPITNFAGITPTNGRQIQKSALQSDPKDHARGGAINFCVCMYRRVTYVYWS